MVAVGARMWVRTNMIRSVGAEVIVFGVYDLALKNTNTTCAGLCNFIGYGEFLLYYEDLKRSGGY
jgi:hypothetical protein